MRRVAFFGNGSVSATATVRDGTVGDRIELFDALAAQGCEVVYIAPEERSPGDPRVVGYTWRGEVDALVIESRDAAFAPVVVPHGDHRRQSKDRSHCPGLEPGNSYDSFCEECTVRSLRDTGAIPVFPQAEVLRDWTEGRFDRVVHASTPSDTADVCSWCQAAPGRCATRPALLFWDFDMNIRRVLGVAGRGSYYEMGKVWRRMTPWMAKVLREIRAQHGGKVRILSPYNVDDTPLAQKRDVASKADKAAGWKPADLDTWEAVSFFDWCYPEWMEHSENFVDPDAPGEIWEARDLVYTGSDYNRRRRWAEFYGQAADNGYAVAVTGVWGNRRRSREKPPWDDTGWRSRVEREWPGVEFLSGAGNRQLPFRHMLMALGMSRAAVQVVPDEYAACGYYTNRVAEAAALGVPLFIDAEIRHHGKERLGFGSPGDEEGWYRVRGWDNLADRFSALGDGLVSTARMVEEQRAGLKETHGAARVTRRLLDVAGVKP